MGCARRFVAYRIPQPFMSFAEYVNTVAYDPFTGLKVNVKTGNRILDVGYCTYNLATEYDERGPVRRFWIADES